MSYVDGFVIAVPTAKKQEYQELAREMAKRFKEWGATRVVECWGDDVPEGKLTDFRRAVKAEAREVRQAGQLLQSGVADFRPAKMEVIDRLNRGENVEPDTYYFRATPYFETSSEKYSWMNKICSVATGSRRASGRTFDVFQSL